MGPAFFTTQRHRRDLYFGIPGLKSLAFHWFFVEASFAGPTTPVLVKLVNGGYGVEVHHLLAKHSLAPTLHAYSKVEGAPTTYITEYLDPSSWKPLSGVSPHPDSATSIQVEIEKVSRKMVRCMVTCGPPISWLMSHSLVT